MASFGVNSFLKKCTYEKKSFIVLLFREEKDKRNGRKNGEHMYLKVNGYTFKGSNSFINLHKGSNLKEKNLLPRSKFFPVRVDPILKRAVWSSKQQKANRNFYKSCFPL